MTFLYNGTGSINRIHAATISTLPNVRTGFLRAHGLSPTSAGSSSPEADRKESRRTGQRVQTDVNVDDLPEHQVRGVFAVTFASMSSGFSTAAESLKVCTWQLGPGQPTLVMDQLSAEDFHMVVDDRADVHVNSKDGRFYLGWFPLGRPGATAKAGRSPSPVPRKCLATASPSMPRRRPTSLLPL